MQIEKLEIPGAFVVVPQRFGDARGYFCESYNKKKLRELTGCDAEFIQDNESVSTKGVLRGMHYQKGEYAQAKLVRVSRGRVVDVIVDLRESSPAFGKYVAVELDADSGRQLFVPRGCAHGFLVLSDTAQFQYKVDNDYSPANECCLRYDDPNIAIAWPLPKGIEPLLSPKDLAGLPFADAPKFP